jgi:phosphoribosyl 1,2-cyclic phosphodiesterase
MRFAVIGSGSKGNALVVQGGGTTILIDCGFAPRELRRRMQSLDLQLGDIKAILLTHGHGDHTKGAKQVAGTFRIPTYASEGTKRFCMGWGGLRNHVVVNAGEPFAIAGLTIRPTATPHDAPGSVCYVVDDGEERFGIATDLGAPCERVASALSSCDALVVEHNHDADMLRTGPYTAHLKRRIAGPRGHLSNDDGTRLLAMAKRPHLTRVLLGHLSEVNNTPALAMESARKIIDGADIELACAPQHHPTGWLRVRRIRGGAKATANAVAQAEPRVAPAAPAKHIALERQLSLFARSR